MGLVQHEIEAAGITTITLSCMPELTASARVARVAGIGYPIGRPLGYPHDTQSQKDILWATLQKLETMKEPGIAYLPFEWQEDTERDAPTRLESTPIGRYLMKHPRQVFQFIRREIPEKFRVD